MAGTVLDQLAALPSSGGVQRILRARDIHSRPAGAPPLMILTPEDLLLAHRQQLARFGKPAPWRCDDRVVAHVSWSQWVTTCPHCSGGVGLDPDWPIGCCFECGAVLHVIAWPSDREAIEAALLQRPDICARNWFEPYTVAELLAENRAHGIEG